MKKKYMQPRIIKTRNVVPTKIICTSGDLGVFYGSTEEQNAKAFTLDIVPMTDTDE